MKKFELDYAELVGEILKDGVNKITRNGIARSLFGKSLVIDDIQEFFPIIQGRQMHIKGILGEFAAMVRQPKHIDDFEKWGCNYWKLWADEHGYLDIDYGNAWFADGQIDRLKECLKNNNNDRRMIVSGWVPKNIKNNSLSLPCCHYSYQFYVAEGKLSMIWTQRSVDMMIGLPSDIVLAAIWLITLANEFDYEVGHIKMDLGDCHIYDEHIPNAAKYVAAVVTANHFPLNQYPQYFLESPVGKPFEEFEPDDLMVSRHDGLTNIKFKLKA